MVEAAAQAESGWRSGSVPPIPACEPAAAREPWPSC